MHDLFCENDKMEIWAQIISSGMLKFNEYEEVTFTSTSRERGNDYFCEWNCIVADAGGHQNSELYEWFIHSSNYKNGRTGGKIIGALFLSDKSKKYRNRKLSGNYYLNLFVGLLRLQQIYQGLRPGNESFQVETVKRIQNTSEAIDFLRSLEELSR